MRESPSPRDPEAFLRRLDWTVVRRLDGLLHGEHRTLFRGYGLDLAELREYQEGDDVRRIDWNVTARLDTPYVREYHEDRDLTAWFLLDLSRSIDFGARVKKEALSTGFVAALARLLTRRGNRVGALVYRDRVETMIPPRAGRRHVLELLHRMMQRADGPSQATKLAELLAGASRVLRRRSLVFVVSDFISEPGWEKPLGELARRHELVAVRVSDPLERELPDLGLVTLQDPETGEELFVDTHDRGFRRRFAEAAARREAELKSHFAGAGVDQLELSTEEPLLDAIVRFARTRRRKR
jgi:uncharacterized protein (DUF58 family)